MTLTTTDHFIEAFNRGIEAFEEAGKILVRLIDAEGPSVFETIRQKNPLISEPVLEFFERVGRKQLYYKLGLADSPGTRALRRCPYSDQVRYFSEPIPLLLVDGDTLQASIHSLTSEQAKQAIGLRRVRTLGEQRAYIEAARVRPQPIGSRSPYTIRGGKVIFHEPCTLTVSDLARLIGEASPR